MKTFPAFICAIFALPFTSTAAHALTATFENVPESHDGSRSFNVTLRFDEPIFPLTFQRSRTRTTQQWKRDRIRAALGVSGGFVSSIRAVKRRRTDAWRINIKPTRDGTVTFSARSTGACDQPGALCTAGGDPLSPSVQASVGGPVIMRLEEPAGEAPYGYVPEGQPLVFTVTLRAPTSDAGGALRPVDRIVTVDYETRDYTAHAPGDYTSMSGTLVFPSGVTSKTISVPTIDDTHDDNGEAMYLVLTNARGATIPGRSLSARGAIGNADPMPTAWLGRFGRTVAEQVVGAVSDRISASRAPASALTLAGERVEFHGAQSDSFEESSALRSLSDRDLFAGSAFALTGSVADGGSGALWGRGTVSSFEGRDAALAVEGEVRSAMLGADFSTGPALGGLMVAVSRGEGAAAGGGEITSTLTGVYPYGRYQLSEDVSAWAVAGYGEGELALTARSAPALETDIDLAMAAAGFNRTVLDGGEDGLSLVLNTGGLAARTSSDPVDGPSGKLGAASATVTLLRLGVESAWQGLTFGSVSLVPSIEIGVRHDGGDAERGLGAEIGAGLAWSDPIHGVSAGLRTRALLTHEESALRERSVSASLAWAPHPNTGRGPSLRLSHSVGDPAMDDVSALLVRETVAGLDAIDSAGDLSNRLEATFAYGMAALGDRFTATPELGFGLTHTGREFRLGWSLARAHREGGVGTRLALEATRRESRSARHEPEHGVGLRLDVAW